MIRGKYFEIHEASNCVDRMYEALQAESDTGLWIGRNITGVLFERSSDFFQSPEGFIRMVKVCYIPGQIFFVLMLTLLVRLYVTFLCQSIILVAIG